MKKLLLSFAALIGLTTGAIAQTAELKISDAQKNISVNKTSYVLKDKKLVPSRRADVSSGWYEFTKAYEVNVLLGQQLPTSVYFIQPDTNLYTIYSDGTKGSNAFFGIVGTSFDPKDSTFLNQSEVLTRFNPYTVDSLFFTQFYVRQLDKVKLGGNLVDVVDTAYVQYFNITGLEIGGFTPSAGQPQLFTYPSISKLGSKNLMNTAALKTDTILLGKQAADSVEYENGVPKRFFGRQILLTPNVKSRSTNGANGTQSLFAFSVVYKPMVKAALGDTAITFDGSTWSKKYNLFALRIANLTGHKQEITTRNKLNNMFVTPKDLLFGRTVNGWKSYIPGNAYGSTYFFPSSIYITTPNLSTNKINSGISGIQVYPNPAASNAQVDVVFNLSANAMVKTVVTDMNGRVVLSNEAKQYVTGQNAVVVNTNGLSSGIYMVTLESAAGRMSSKLTVN